MSQITREQLHAFLDDALSEADSARIERTLRDSEALQQRLRQVIQERDRGEHSVGAIWRRHRLTCASREKLGSYLLGVLPDEELDYLRFHLDTVCCPYCQANLADLQAQQEAPAASQQRRKRFFQSSAGLLQPGDRG
jgi:anti-sigma factor RsiW